MHLSRFGFNLLAAVYLAPLLCIDIVGNTFSEGDASDLYFYKAAFDGLLLAFAVYQMVFGAETATASSARARQADHSDAVVAFENLGAIEWVYCALLSGYAAVTLDFLHDINKHSTGLLSMATLIWSFLSIVVAILAGIQFYRLKSGAIVELQKRITQ
jgi:hypothetical protein